MKYSKLVSLKKKKLALISEYDKSQAVNSFLLNGSHVWLDKATRVGLVNSLNAEKLVGYTTTTLWLEGISYTIPIDVALQMLIILEVYAKECYNITEIHKASINAETDINRVYNYNYTKGYPERPTFNV